MESRLPNGAVAIVKPVPAVGEASLYKAHELAMR